MPTLLANQVQNSSNGRPWRCSWLCYNICTALAYLAFFALVDEVGASRGTVITYVNPAVSVLLGVTLLGEPLDAAIVVGFLLIILGSWLSTGGVLPPQLGQLQRTRLRQQAAHQDLAAGRQDASCQQPQ